MYEIGLEHSFAAAHRVVGHEGGMGKCARLHGHGYTVRVKLQKGELDATGFVTDYGVLKAYIDEWDHRCLLWEDDPFVVAALGDFSDFITEVEDDVSGIIRLTFNPTAENMAKHLARGLASLSEANYVWVHLRESPLTFAEAKWGTRQ
jgi:6-pyruvoyltetrahydropterin/6-carboxytetrahydropterin synthase